MVDVVPTHPHSQDGGNKVTSSGDPVVISHKAPTASVQAVGRGFLYGGFVKVHACMLRRVIVADHTHNRPVTCQLHLMTTPRTSQRRTRADHSSTMHHECTSVTEEELVKACDGLTGHKYAWAWRVTHHALILGYRAARHGMGLLGKLQRIEEADRQFALQFVLLRACLCVHSLNDTRSSKDASQVNSRAESPTSRDGTPQKRKSNDANASRVDEEPRRKSKHKHHDSDVVEDEEVDKHQRKHKHKHGKHAHTSPEPEADEDKDDAAQHVHRHDKAAIREWAKQKKKSKKHKSERSEPREKKMM